jgi:hypothetical protein
VNPCAQILFGGSGKQVWAGRSRHARAADTGRATGRGRHANIHTLRLRTLQAHHPYRGRDSRGRACEGDGMTPRPYDPGECGDYMAYYGTPGLREAIWSVAIESPGPGWEPRRGLA